MTAPTTADDGKVAIYEPVPSPNNTIKWRAQSEPKRPAPLALLDCILQALLNQEARKET